VCVLLLGVACVWASVDEEETVTDNFVSSSAAVHPKLVSNLAVLSTKAKDLIKARTVAHLPEHNDEEISGNVFTSHPADAEEVSAEDELGLGSDEDSVSDSARFASATPAAPAAPAKSTAPPAIDPAGPPRPKGVAIDATAPTPPPPAPKKKKEEVQRVAIGSLDGPVQRHGDKPDAVLESVKDILAVPEKDGLPDATLTTTKVVGTAKCGDGCTRKLPVMVGWAGLNERPAHKTGRRVSLPGDRARVRAQHEALKVPSKYTWQQRDLNKARRHLKASAKRIKELRRARKKIGDTPLARQVIL